MVYTHLSPAWFFGYDVLLEISFAVVSLIIALFAFKIYKSSAIKQVHLFGLSFLLISISYIIQSILNFMIISKLNENVSKMIKLQSIVHLNTLGFLIHMFFMIIGLSILLYTTFKTENRKLFWLLIVVSLLLLFLSRDAPNIFYLIVSVYLFFISFHFIGNYRRNRQPKTLLIALAFLLLLFGNTHFIFILNHNLFYPIGHILELFAYILILWNFYLVRKK